jgi:hypothetical protein
MDDKELRIVIDANGNIHREIIDQSPPEKRKPKLLKRIVSVLPI